MTKFDRSSMQRNRGVCFFIADEGRDFPHGDARRTDENQSVLLRKFEAVHTLFDRQKAGLGKPRERVKRGVRIRQKAFDAFCRLDAGPAVAEDGGGHLEASRNPVAKAGS